MSSVSDFAMSAARIEDTPSPFREALLQRIQKNESVRHLIFSPAFGVAKLRALASLVCVTDRRWLIVLREGDGSIRVDESSFDSALLVELTIILLYGQLKIDFVLNGNVRTTSLQFNTVMHHVYSEAIQDILDSIDSKACPDRWGRGDRQDSASAAGESKLPDLTLRGIIQPAANLRQPRASAWLDPLQAQCGRAQEPVVNLSRAAR